MEKKGQGSSLMGKDIVDRLFGLDTCTVSDAMDRCGLRGAVIGIHPVWSCPRIAGRVVTIRLKPVGLERPKQHLGTTAIDAAKAGDVLVVDNAGRVDVASWGGILALGAKTRQIQGVIIDGVCRDVDEIRDIGLPVYARGVVPITARGAHRARILQPRNSMRGGGGAPCGFCHRRRQRGRVHSRTEGGETWSRRRKRSPCGSKR